MLAHSRLGGLAGSIFPLHLLAAEDAELASQNRGRLEVVVRSADRPTQALPGAQAVIHVRQSSALSRMTDERGLAVFDSLDVGEHEIVVRRVGYGQSRAVVPVKPRCQTDAEAYIAVSAVGLRALNLTSELR